MATNPQLQPKLKKDARGLERRVFEFELRAGEGDATPKIIGHASVFNKPADLGYFIETVKPGAFSRTIQQEDIRALFNHDPNYVLGRNRAGTLSLSEDAIGLAIENTPPDTQWARDLQVSIRRRDITQMSIGFYARGATFRKDGDQWYRDLTDIQLFDVSPVTYPAFVETDVNVRTAEAIFTEFRSGPDNLQPTDEEWKHDLDHRERMLQLARD